MVIICKHAKHIKEVHDTLTQAVANGTISEVRLDEAVRRLPFCEYYVPILVPVRVPKS